jgi:hypothetical protein
MDCRISPATTRRTRLTPPHRRRSGNSAFINDARPPSTRPKAFFRRRRLFLRRELGVSCRARRESTACRAGG